jgi:hypothetical protein
MHITHAHEFQQAEFSGCIGSTDATHIAIERCIYRLRNNHLSPKQHLTTCTFNLTVNHCRHILSTTVGYPGRWNDKTVVLFDSFVRGIYEGSVVPDLSFELFECDEFGNTSTTEYRGPWLIVDNGYLQWSTTVPPLKHHDTEAERRWSQWLESLRKEVECTFGILKCRWRILKTGIRLEGMEVANNI